MKKKADARKIKLAVLLWILVVVLLYFIIYVAPGVTDIFVESYVVEYGTVDVEHEIDYLCIRNERIHTSDNSGSVKRIIKAGNLVRNNSKIMMVGGINYYSRIRGIVSYVYDGFEKKYSPDNLYDIKIGDVIRSPEKGAETHSVRSCPSKNAELGNPIYKIVDNSMWYFVSYLNAEDIDSLTIGQNVRVKINEDDDFTVPFKVLDIEEHKSPDAGEKDNKELKKDEKQSELEKKYRLILSSDRNYDNFDRLRFGKATLITSRETGIILETSSIVMEDGQKGVYVLNKYNNFVFTPISIIAEIGDKTVVKNRIYYDTKSEKMVNTVKNYDSVKKGDSGNVN